MTQGEHQCGGVLRGLKIVELAGIGPAPFAGMMLADHGAQVVRIERSGTPPGPTDVLARPRTVLQLDLKPVCFAPVPDFDEAVAHPHDRMRQTFFHLDGIVQPSSAPQFLSTPAPASRAPGAAFTR